MLIVASFVFGISPIGKLPAAAYGETKIPYAVSGGNIYFDPNKGAVIDCDDTVTEATIPERIGGIKVEVIENSAFRYRNNLISVTLPEGLKPSVAMPFTAVKL